MLLRFKKTCNACPEQYDVFTLFGGKQVAYVKLRFGVLTVSSTDNIQKNIYVHTFTNNSMKGNFADNEERKKYIKIIKKEINKYYTKTPRDIEW